MNVCNLRLNSLDIGARLDKIRLLKDGWFEGVGQAPSKEGIDWLEKFFKSHYPDETVLPRLYPTPDGDIRAEWSNDQWDLSLDIHLASKRGTWHGLNLETDDDEMRDMNLENEGDWAWLIDRLKENLGETD